MRHHPGAQYAPCAKNSVRGDHTGQTVGRKSKSRSMPTQSSNYFHDFLRGFNKSGRAKTPLCDRRPLYFVNFVLIYCTPGFPSLPFTKCNAEKNNQ